MHTRPTRASKTRATKLIAHVDESELEANSSESDSWIDPTSAPHRKSFGQQDAYEDDESHDESPPAKRRKIAVKPRKGKGVARRGNAGKLSQLPELSLDILFTIFGLLHPKDLMHLTCVSKLFRRALLAPSASSVWINSRKDFGYNCPPPGEGLSESYWAYFIWDNKCYVCYTSGVPGYDFAWRKRICKRCFGWYTRRRAAALCHLDPCNELVLDLVSPPSDLTYGSDRLWNKDVERVAREFTQLEKNVENKIPNAANALEKYIAERSRFVAGVQDHAKICKEWYHKMLSQKDNDGRDIQKERKEEIIRRFKELGYTDDEVHMGITWQPSAMKEKELTHRSWVLIRPGLEQDILVGMAQNSANFNRTVISSRLELLDNVYKRYKRAKFPNHRDWISLPPTYVLERLAIFNRLLYTMPDQTLGDHRLQEIVDQGKLDISIRKFKAQRERAMKKCQNDVTKFLAVVAKMPIRSQYEALNLTLSPSSMESSKVFKQTADILSLALSVFLGHNRRSQHPVDPEAFLFGSEAIERQTPTNVPKGAYLPEWDTNAKTDNPWNSMTFCQGARQVLMCLLHTLKEANVEGFEITQVDQLTIAELDRLDARWMCVSEECINTSPIHSSSFHRKRLRLLETPLLHWRAAVLHAISQDRSGFIVPGGLGLSFPHLHHQPKFRLLSPAETIRVKTELEPAIRNTLLDDNNIWWCTECLLVTPLKRNDVLEHVKDVHGVDDLGKREEYLMLAPGETWPTRSFLNHYTTLDKEDTN